MKIDVNEQSSIRIETDNGTVIYCDPFRISGETHDADIILITHSHYDHFSPEDIEKVCNKQTNYIAPNDVGLTAKKVLLPGESTDINGLKITAVPAYNIGKLFHPRLKKWVGYLINADGTNVYVTGDTDATPEAKNVKCDIILLPIGGKFTMNPIQAAALVCEINPGTAIPTHYGSVVGSKQDFDVFAANVKCEVEKKLWTE